MKIRNTASKLLSDAKYRAKQKGIEFDIELSDIIIPPVCPILLVPLIPNKIKCGPNSPSLDRIDPNKGYVKGNIQVISHKANSMKQNASDIDLVLFADWIRKKTNANN